MVEMLAHQAERLRPFLGAQAEPNGLGTERSGHIHGHAHIEIEPAVADDQVRRSGHDFAAHACQNV
jgi:hypothetical protein